MKKKDQEKVLPAKNQKILPESLSSALQENQSSLITIGALLLVLFGITTYSVQDRNQRTSESWNTFADVIGNIRPDVDAIYLTTRVKDLNPNVQKALEEKVGGLDAIGLEKQVKENFQVESFRDLPLLFIPKPMANDAVSDTSLQKLEQNFTSAKNTSAQVWLGYYIGNIYHRKGGTENLKQAEKYLSLVSKGNIRHPLSEPIMRDLELISKEMEVYTQNPQLQSKTEVVREGAEKLSITTSKGKISVDIFPKENQAAVESFRELVLQGFFNGLNFYQVNPERISSGCTMGTGKGGTTFSTEIQSKDIVPQRGFLALEKMDPNGGFGSRFFILKKFSDVSSTNELVLIGEVTEGMDIVDKLTQLDVLLDVSVAATTQP